MAEMKTMLSAVEGVINGKVSAGEMILNDYRLIIEDIEGGHRLTATRGSEVQSIDIMDGVDGFTPTISIASGVQPDVSGGAIVSHKIIITDVNGTKEIMLRDGKDGADGTSSRVTVSQAPDGALIQSSVIKPDGSITNTMAVVKDGKTPEKGVDYFTGDEVQDIIFAAGAGKLSFDPTKQGLPIFYMWGDTTGESKDNEVTLTYQFGEHSGTLTRKWQGSGSVDLGTALGIHIYGDGTKGKFNYTIKLDNAIEAKDGWGLQKKYCLKAYVADFSHARDLCALKLYGNACANRTYPPIDLYKCPNWGGVDGFPILLIVNDEYYGLYSMNIPKDGWMLNMPTEGATREAIVCAEVGANFSGPVTIGNGKTYEIEYVTDENDTAWVKESLDALMTAIANANYAEISSRIDIDSAIDYLLLVAKCTGGDAVARNYLMYTRDGVKWAIVPYDADTWFGISWGGEGHISDDYLPTLIDCAWDNALMKYLIQYAPAKIVTRYNELRGDVLSASKIAETVLDFSAQIPKAVFDAEVARWPGIGTTGTNNANQIVDHVRAREAIIDAEIARLDAPMMASGASWYNTAAAGAEMNTITDINFNPNYMATGSEEAVWDCSALADGSIMAYRTGTIVTIKPTNHKYVRLNLNSVGMFANDGINGSFANLARITGTEIFVANVGTSMHSACRKLQYLRKPIFIPEGVINTMYMFHDCWRLATPPSIPNGVMYMKAMFSGSALSALPQLPITIIEIDYAFSDCVSAQSLPRIIPGNVTMMKNAFSNCKAAHGLMRIESLNLTDYGNAFTNACTQSDGIVLTGPSPLLAEIAATNTDGKVTVYNA